MSDVREVVVLVLVGMVLLGGVPALAAFYQFTLLIRHRWHDHYSEVDPSLLPRLAILVPAWNEELVLRHSVDAMMRLDYPDDRLRLVVIDDASTDGTPELMASKERDYPGRVTCLRREQGGQGKSHTLNHGLREVLADPWTEAVLITDADVVFQPTAIRRMVRHLADPHVGSVSAFIREASEDPNWLNRSVGYEYVVAQAAARRAQNVIGVQACLAGGAQLHTRANLEQQGGCIDTSTLAEDTVTTFLTQMHGRLVVFDGNAECLAEEPRDIHGLWKQRLRWSRGNIQVTRRFASVFFHRSDQHSLGNVWFGVQWFATLLLPVFAMVSSVALLGLWFLDGSTALSAFQWTFAFTAAGFIFSTFYSLALDPRMARVSWFQAITFPGLVSLAILVWAIAPGPTQNLVDVAVPRSSVDLSSLLLAAYLWQSLCMVMAWAVYRAERAGLPAPLVALLMLFVGYGPLLCAITFAAYVAEARGAANTWEKTEKTGRAVLV